MQNSDTFGGYYSRTSARYPHYFEKVQRRRSYIDWPPEKQQTPDQLAEAGFYHAGPQDCTRCFYCGGGIKNWSPGDIPDVEHARWFSHCQYIISKKGQNFVNNVNINHPRHTETDGPKEEAKFEAKDFDDLIAKILKSSSGKALEILGYKADIIRAACARVLNLCAWDINSITTEALATEAIELEVKHRDSEPSEPEHLEGAVGGATGGHESAGNFVGASGVSSRSKHHFSNPVAGEFHGDYAEDDAIGRMELLRIEEPEQRAESGQRAAKGEVSGLSEKMSKLLVENRKLRDERTCKICLEKDVCVVFLPCRHLVTCEDCHSSLSKCPLCRGEIAAAVKAFM